MYINEYDIEELVKLYNALEKPKIKMMKIWQDVVDYVRYTKVNIYDLYSRVNTPPTMDGIYDDTAIRWSERLNSFICSTLTNPDSVWMNIQTDSNKLNKNSAAKRWFEELEEVIMNEYENSNFYTEIKKFYNDLTSFGIAIMYISKSSKTNINGNLNFSTRDIFECGIGENEDGYVDRLCHKRLMTAYQVVAKWGIENVSEETKELYKNNPEELVTIINAVFPREKYSSSKKAKKNKKKFASIWFELDNKSFLERSGIDYFPYVITRWSRDTGEIYGTSPIIDCLPSIKTANAMKYTQVLNGEFQADAPIVYDERYYKQMKKYKPGVRIPVQPRQDGSVDKIIVPVLTNAAQFTISVEQLAKEQENIKDALYGNQIQTPGVTKEMTAYEFRMRQLEATKILGPTASILRSEMLAPTLLISIGVMSTIPSDVDKAKSILPDAPQEILDEKLNYRFRYISTLSKSQRLHEVESINYIIQTAMQWAQINPSVMDNIDMDYSFRRIHGSDMCPEGMLVDETERDKKRAIKAKQQEQEREMMIRSQQAEAMKNLGAANKNFQGQDAEAIANG